MKQQTDPKTHRNTVSTYLKILVEKGYLSTSKEGRVFKYTVIVPLEEYKKFLLKELVHKFFDASSGKEILQLLLNEKIITLKDIKEYFDLKIEIKPVKFKDPKFKIAQEILNSKKEKEKEKKSKGKYKYKYKKKKKKRKKKHQSNLKNIL